MTTSIATYRTILVDSSAWIALAVSRDGHHTAAVATYDRLRLHVRFATTWGVISETYSWLLYRPGRRHATAFLNEVQDLLDRGTLHMIYPTPATDSSTHRELARFADQQLSFVDAFNLAAARSAPDIDAIFAFDRHMHLAGLPVLPS